MTATDEIDYHTFTQNASALDIYLRPHVGPEGMRFVTYAKLPALQTIWEKYYQALMNEFGFHLQPGDIVIDIGAHHGIVALNCARQGARVIAYEPNPINLEILRRNVALNPDFQIIVEGKAVAAKDGSVAFNFGKTSTTGALLIAERDWKRTETNLIVEAISLKTLLRAHGIKQIRLLKIDCEGGEYDALMEAPSPILRSADFICAEAHPTRRHKPEALKALLERTGFSVIEREAEHGCYEFYCQRLD